MIFLYIPLVVLFSVHYQLLLDSNRWAHFLVCMFLTMFAKRLNNSYILTVVIVFSIGLAKEMQDPVFDGYDILANCSGILIGILL